MKPELIWNRADCTVRLGDLAVVAAPRHHPPFSCQAFVHEQDTNLLLGEQTTLRDPGKPAWYLANILEEAPTSALGSVIIRGQAPVHLLAIIHDIEKNPTCQQAHITTAYQNIWHIAQQTGLSTIGMPLLGTVHGKLPVDVALSLFRSSLESHQHDKLQHIWLIWPASQDCRIGALIK